jgi:hypothetical protein
MSRVQDPGANAMHGKGLRQLGEQLECVSASVGKYDQRTDER